MSHFDRAYVVGYRGTDEHKLPAAIGATEIPTIKALNQRTGNTGLV